jgi:predicted RNA binding protein YcfA (HicA-like mRNA interferase family)
MGAEKTLGRVLSGASDAAIRFDDLCQLLESLGFEKRVRGSHHLFPNAKPYQVRQVRSVILKAGLGTKQ